MNQEEQRTEWREAKRLWRKDHNEQYRATARVYEGQPARRNRWRFRDKDLLRVYWRTYAYKNRQERIRNTKEWAQSHPEQRRLIKQIASLRHYARKIKALPNNFTILDWQALLKEHHHTCVYCGLQSESLTQDHVVPLSKGGPHTKGNIVPACTPCNSSKHARSVEDFLALKEAS